MSETQCSRSESDNLLENSDSLKKPHITGSCLCGEVQYECVDNFKAFHFCHCHQCQKISGGAHVANLFLPDTDLSWVAGSENIQRYDVPGRHISNAFCTQCGSSVPYRTQSGPYFIVPAGLLESAPTSCKPQDNIFWDERVSWYEEGLTTTKYPGMPED